VIPVAVLSEGERNFLRQQWASKDRKIIAFFGFSYPHKGVEKLFEIADPVRHHLLLIGNLTQTDAYHVMLRGLANSARWCGHVTITGFVDQTLAARYLAAADAAVFPFINGGGHWNSSLHAAVAQGVFVIATSNDQRGYDPVDNVYYAAPGAVSDMAEALLEYAGIRTRSSDQQVDPWVAIAQSHLDLYRKCLARA
jgi:glycosyltransferase involved in cell wall biosynthesis